jgi:hypothetical protein
VNLFTKYALENIVFVFLNQLSDAFMARGLAARQKSRIGKSLGANTARHHIAQVLFFVKHFFFVFLSKFKIILRFNQSD